MTETTFWWVRHGPTHAKTMIGWTDLPADLSDRAAIKRLSDYLPADAPVISSPLSRAVETADALQDGRGRLTHDPDLREIHFGQWENRTFADIDASEPALIRAFWETPGAARAPGGEGWHDLSKRVCGAADRLLGHGPEVIVVAHFGAILTQIERATGMTTTEVFGHKIDNLSVTCVVHGRSGWRAETINHLP
ncbi:histidine phosphatase family protein [Rhodobacteraceae bacterium SC52]|nr:histidine phosphatase family protein [Rhodobacteraceae bacterium SC52]